MSYAATRMNLESTILSEVSQEDKCLYITYIRHLKYDGNELTDETNSQTDRKNRLVVAKQEGGGEGHALGVWG